MNKLIYISKGMEDGYSAAYIEKIADELGAKFEKHELEDILNSTNNLTSPRQWLFFLWPLTEAEQSLLKDLKLSYYLLYDGAVEYKGDFLNLLETDRLLVSPIDTSRDHRLHIPLLRNNNSNINEDSRKQLLNVGNNLNQMIEFSLSELQRVKRLHEQVVPMKSDNFKGVNILSKFAAGEGAGGEFFDVVSGSQEVLLLLTSTSSYVASSVVLSHFERLRAYSSFDHTRIENFVVNLSKELKQLNLIDNENSDSLQLLVAKVDLNKMKFEGVQFGSNKLISSKNHTFSSNSFPVGKAFLDQAAFSFDLERGEKLLISSPGVNKNCGGMIDNRNYSNFIKEKLALPPREILNEIYFQLKKDRDSDFLKFDASVIYIEVDKNVIIEV